MSNIQENYPLFHDFCEEFTMSPADDAGLPEVLEEYKLTYSNQPQIHKDMLDELLKVKTEFTSEPEMEKFFKEVKFNWYITREEPSPVPAKSYLELNDYLIAFFEKLVGEMEAKAD
jgi:hypothetical protein